MEVEIYYKRYGAMVLRRCRKLLGNEEMAQDALQECFMRVLNSGVPEVCGSSYFYTVATRLCLNILRSKEYRRGLAPQGECVDLMSQLDLENHALHRNFLGKFFNLISERDREIAIYFYLDEMTLEETANLAGLSVPQIRRRLQALKSKVNELWRYE